MKAKLKELELVGYTITVINGGYWVTNEIGEGVSVTKNQLKEGLDKFFNENF